jgi:hypothetical protein
MVATQKYLVIRTPTTADEAIGFQGKSLSSHESLADAYGMAAVWEIDVGINVTVVEVVGNYFSIVG